MKKCILKSKKDAIELSQCGKQIGKLIVKSRKHFIRNKNY